MPAVLERGLLVGLVFLQTQHLRASLGQPAAGLEVLVEALTRVDTTRDRWYEPEIYRLKGALLLQQSADNHAEAQNCFHHALDVARAQQAKSLELRIAVSLSRLWQHQGQRAAAYDLLAPVYGCFTEGFDTADLQDAKTLLEELSCNQDLQPHRISATPERVVG